MLSFLLRTDLEKTKQTSTNVRTKVKLLHTSSLLYARGNSPEPGGSEGKLQHHQPPTARLVSPYVSTLTWLWSRARPGYRKVALWRCVWGLFCGGWSHASRGIAVWAHRRQLQLPLALGWFNLRFKYIFKPGVRLIQQHGEHLQPWRYW